MRQRVKNLDAVTDALKPFLEQYLEQHNIDPSKHFNCLNPKHTDNNGSMSTKGDVEYHVANCFGCGCAVDIFTAAHYLENKPIKGPAFIEENVLYLADKFGIKMELEDLTPDEIYEYRTYEAYKYASKLISDPKFGDYSKIDKEIARRGWDKDKCAQWGIGTVNFKEYKEKMKLAGYDVRFLEGVDLERSNLFDNHNLLFTVCDDFGRPVGFSAKNLKHKSDDKYSGPRYINTRGTGLECAIFKKGERLYGFNISKTAPSPLYIFEGQADVITARHYGLMNCCCTLGTALTDHHINLLKKHGIFNIILVFDSDEGGEKATVKALDNRFSDEKDFRVKLIQLPEGQDPDELLRESGIDEFIRLKKWTAFEWRMTKFIEEIGEDNTDDNEDKRREIAEKMAKIIVTEKSHVHQEQMAKQVAKMTGYTMQTIISEVKRLRNEKESAVQDKKRAAVDALMNDMRQNPEDIEIALTQCQSAIADINKSSGTKSGSNGILDLIMHQKEHDENRTEDFAGFKMSPEGLGNIAKELDDDWTTGSLLYIGGSEQAGKCVHSEALTQLPSGERLTIEEVVKRKEPIVLGMDNSKKIVPMKVSRWIDSGELECFEVKTEQGISTKVSESHPYFTLNGWKKVKELNSGDKVAIVRKYDCFNNLKSPISETKAELLGLFLAEGCLTNGPVFSNTDEEIIQKAKEICHKEWDEVEFTKKGANCFYLKDNLSKGNRVKDWLKSYDLLGKTAHTKLIPNDIFRCSPKRIAKFLGMFWAGDGWVHFNPNNKNKCEVGLTLANYKMIKQIRSLLLRFGIKTKITNSPKKNQSGKLFEAWTISIKDINNIKKFYNNIKIPLKYKQDNLKGILQSDKTAFGSYNDNFPTKLWDRIKEKTKKKGWTFNYLLKLIGEDRNRWNYDKSKNRFKEVPAWRPTETDRKQKGQKLLQISERKLRLIGQILQDQLLIDLADGDIYFDKITSIKAIGKHQCYDLEIPNDHNFIVEDTVVHNTTFCTQMAYEIATENENVICIYHSIDDAARFIIYKWVCQAAGELMLELNHTSNPNYWNKQEGLGWIKTAREAAYKKIIKLVKQGKLILSDATAGSSLAFSESLVKEVRENNPTKKIVLFIDNFHKLPDYSEIRGHERIKLLSNHIKNMTVSNNITVVSTVEYRKLQQGEKPSNLAIAESRSLAYDASVIIHLFNELHLEGEHNSVLQHIDDQGKVLPRIWCKFGKNKVSGFEGRTFLDLYPSNASYRSVDVKQVEEEQKERLQYIKENSRSIM